MKDESVKKAHKIIEKIFYITIASVSKKGIPWNTPVFSAYDENYNFYWGSHRDSQHSKNVRDRGDVFLVIYDSTVDAGMGEGVYVKAHAVELSDPKEIAHAHTLLQTRRPIPYWKIEQVQGDAPIRLYMAVPEKFWVNGEGNIDGNYIDIREDADLLNKQQKK